ncbi:hypothetical protein BGZ83_007315 [Gryganskiella cystojenkinii]|nr:hypothetical protein BGZ83_007315 [Gryganskiella cystojenkinii]
MVKLVPALILSLTAIASLVQGNAAAADHHRARTPMVPAHNTTAANPGPCTMPAPAHPTTATRKHRGRTSAIPAQPSTATTRMGASASTIPAQPSTTQKHRGSTSTIPAQPSTATTSPAASTPTIPVVPSNAGACTLTVPAQPLTANGLATPYILMTGGCDQTNPAQQVFVEATVFDPATSTFSVYHPLVINQGTVPAIKPVLPILPKNAIVGIWFGANSNSITLKGDIGTCVNGLSNQDVFGQVAFCNAQNFFAAVKAAKGVVIPPLGNDVLGKACPTTRSFGIIDQDQSDNVITTYLMKGTTFAQTTAANRKTLGQVKEISNGSDNALVADFIDPAIGCKPFKAPSLMEAGVMLGSLALNELHATQQAAPVAEVPAADPMVLSNNQPSLAKLNAYRLGVDQTVLTSLNQATTLAYCTNLGMIGPAYIQRIQKLIQNGPSPMPDVANNLLTFMGQRYAASWTNLGCDKTLNKPSAITTTAVNGIATAIQINLPAPGKRRLHKE